MLKERYRLTGLSWQYHRCLYDLIHAETPTQGASMTSTTTCPGPCAIIPHPGAASKANIRLCIEHETILRPSDHDRMEVLKIDDQITPITPLKRSEAKQDQVG